MCKKVYVVGNKVNIPDCSLISQHNSKDCSLVFVGKMSYEPNVVAVTYFAEHVLPDLLKHYPQLKFMIVGAHPDMRVQKLAEKEGVQVTGYVDSIEPYFQNATIVVAPMLTGAGIQNKIIQAMSYGCCVVTTTIGAEGLNIQHNEIAIANGNGEIKQVILSLLSDVNKRREMGRLAREYVINNLSDEVIGKQFWAFIESARSGDSI